MVRLLVEDFPSSAALTAPDECFRLLFAAPAETSLQQGPYDFDHASLGAFALFIVPGNPVGGRDITKRSLIVEPESEERIPQSPHHRKVIDWYNRGELTK